MTSGLHPSVAAARNAQQQAQYHPVSYQMPAASYAQPAAPYYAPHYAPATSSVASSIGSRFESAVNNTMQDVRSRLEDNFIRNIDNNAHQKPRWIMMGIVGLVIAAFAAILISPPIALPALPIIAMGLALWAGIGWIFGRYGQTI